MKQIEVMRTMTEAYVPGEAIEFIEEREAEGWAVRQLLLRDDGVMYVVYETNR